MWENGKWIFLLFSATRVASRQSPREKRESLSPRRERQRQVFDFGSGGKAAVSPMATRSGKQVPAAPWKARGRELWHWKGKYWHETTAPFDYRFPSISIAVALLVARP